MVSNGVTKERLADPNFQYGRWLSSPEPGEEVVISGMCGRFPDTRNVDDFRDKLFNKEELLTSIKSRWKVDRYDVPPRSGQLLDLDKCDVGYFGLHYRQANNMDPAIRILLETALEAIMDAAVNPAELKGSKTGVFIGYSWSDMENETLVKTTEAQRFAITGYIKSMVAHRLSYHLKLKGPSFVMDTACSSSLNAVHAAFKAIRNGDCDNAIVGGCHLVLHPAVTMQFFRLGVLAPDAICKVFDEAADGYVRSEAINCLFLQKAKNSKRIYAQIINTKVNADGFKPEGVTFPSWQCQKQLMVEIYEESDVHPSELSFVEAHGTGTTVGDPEEVRAIDTALAQRRKEQLLMGSVKANIGHSEPASGISSVIKVLIAMETGFVAPNVNLKTIKKTMEGIIEGRMKIITELTELPEDAIVGINNMGFGGANGHVMLRRFHKKKVNGGLPVDEIPRLICVSGRDETAVLQMFDKISCKSLDCEYVGLLHQLYKSNVANHLYRGYIVQSKQGVISKQAKDLPFKQTHVYMFFGRFVNNFRVLGSYMIKFPVFKNIISRIDKILMGKTNKTVEEILKSGKQPKQDILGALCIQIAMVDVFKILEISQASVFDDDNGKIVKAYYCDIIRLEEAVTRALDFSQSYVDCNMNYQNLQKLEKLAFSRNNGNLKRKDVLILNISDFQLNNKDLSVVQGSTVNFLNIVGRLYLEGYLPQVHKLYTNVEFPVSRGTPTISPLIHWHHPKSWFSHNLRDLAVPNIEQKSFNISPQYDEYKFITGHVIDGRNLFPATEYLNLVWQTLAESRMLLVTDIPVIFEDCKFIKAVTVPKSGFVKLFVMIQKGTGNFEVLEKDSLVVTGRIRIADDVDREKSHLGLGDVVGDDPLEIVNEDEIYRELYLRGYNYSGEFKSVTKCNIDASSALIKWNNNWGVFMDNMLQMKMLSTDTRLLCVPVGIKKIVVDPVEHLNVVKSYHQEECLLPAHVYENCDIIKCGGIEIQTLQSRSIFKKKQRLKPVLEKHEFIPNDMSLGLEEAVRVNTQIILENSLENHVKAVEIIDEFTSDSSHLLGVVCRTLEDVPVVTSDLTISSKSVIDETPGVKVAEVTLTPESNMLLIIGSKLLQRLNTLNQLLASLSKNGFILTREEVNFTIENIDGMEIITEFRTQSEKIIMLRKRVKSAQFKCVEVSSKTFAWLAEVQNALSRYPNVIVYSKNREPEGILGLVNCIRRESYGNKLKCVFIMDDMDEFDPQNNFYSKQINKNLAVNIYKNGKWGTYRHLLLEELPKAHYEHSYANVKVRGDISSLQWFEGPLTPQTPLQGKLFLTSTFYSAVNFKDIMIASGRVNPEVFTTNRLHQEILLGLEFSGRDLSGRRVTGMTHDQGISSYVTLDPLFSWEVPESWTLEDAATVPVVYCTVMYALLILRDLKSGTSILIHSATGGIGLAALNICLHYKCNIFVTVGTPEKREYLRKHYPQIPASHIGNSRDTSFEQMIQEETNNRGVDVVLNSLSDEKLQASIRCLAHGGRFMEIGKYDLANDTALSMLVMEKGGSYHGVHLDKIFQSSEEIKTKINACMRDGIRAGFVKPLPRVVFNSEQVVESYRYMMTGKHIGKILIQLRDENRESTNVANKLQLKANPRFCCDVRYSYIIIGGLGGVGLELADWLVLRGARKLVLVSRSGLQSGYQKQRIRIWQSYGAEIYISTQKVTTYEGCRRLIEEAAKLGPVDGVFNLAVILKDALFEDQTKEHFLASVEPKAVATIHLDRITRELFPKLRYFVIFSSVSCGRGNAGQSNYGMANSVMERICERRKSDGFSGVAIQWGAIGDVGLVAKMKKDNKELIIGGTLQQKISSCLEVLDVLLKHEHPVVSSIVVAEKHYKSDGLLSPVDAVAQILGVEDMKTVSAHATLAELGMDSMMGTEVVQVLEKDFEIYITSKDVRSLTFAKLREMDTERDAKKGAEEKLQKSEFLIQYISDTETNYLPLANLSSEATRSEDIPNVFLFPGVEGTFQLLDGLVNEMKAHVTGVRYNNIDPGHTIREIARNLLVHIEIALLKTTPFFFVAHSFGAVICTELASLLEDKGYKGTIILIDGSPAYCSTSIKKHFNYEQDATFQTDLLQKMLSFVVPLDVLAEHKDAFLQCKDLKERINLGIELMPAEAKKKQSIDRQMPVGVYARLRATVNYELTNRKIKSPVYLFKAKYAMAEEEDDYQLSKVCENLVQVTAIEGDHVSILSNPELYKAVNGILTVKMRS